MDPYCLVWCSVWFTDNLIQFVRWYYCCWPSCYRLSSPRIRGAAAISALVDQSHPSHPPKGWGKPRWGPKGRAPQVAHGSEIREIAVFLIRQPKQYSGQRVRDREYNRATWRLSVLPDKKYSFNKYNWWKAILLTGVPVHLSTSVYWMGKRVELCAVPFSSISIDRYTAIKCNIQCLNLLNSS